VERVCIDLSLEDDTMEGLPSPMIKDDPVKLEAQIDRVVVLPSTEPPKTEPIQEDIEARGIGTPLSQAAESRTEQHVSITLKSELIDSSDSSPQSEILMDMEPKEEDELIETPAPIMIPPQPLAHEPVIKHEEQPPPITTIPGGKPLAGACLLSGVERQVSMILVTKTEKPEPSTQKLQSLTVLDMSLDEDHEEKDELMDTPVPTTLPVQSSPNEPPIKCEGHPPPSMVITTEPEPHLESATQPVVKLEVKPEVKEEVPSASTSTSRTARRRAVSPSVTREFPGVPIAARRGRPMPAANGRTAHTQKMKGTPGDYVLVELVKIQDNEQLFDISRFGLGSAIVVDDRFKRGFSRSVIKNVCSVSCHIRI
jgi:hypothetical protein